MVSPHLFSKFSWTVKPVLSLSHRDLIIVFVLLLPFIWSWIYSNYRQPIVAAPPSVSWWQGNFKQVFHPNAWNYHRYLSETFGGVVRIRMFFNQEALYISDSLALQHIVVKEQHIYEETEGFMVSSGLVFGDSLLSTIGERHRRQRRMLNPLFSTQSLRNIFPAFIPIVHELEALLARNIEEGARDIDMARWFSRTALEFIGRGALGYSFGSLEEQRSTAYSAAVKNLGVLLSRTAFPRLFLPYVVKVSSPRFRRRLLDMAPFKAWRELAAAVDTMYDGSQEVVQKRKSTIEAGDELITQSDDRRNDIMMRANMQADKADRLPDSEVLGQVNTFVFGGTDTTSMGACRLFDQLAKHPDAQTRLRIEILQARGEANGAEISYDTLVALPFLDAIVRETLRLYSPISIVARTCLQDTMLPVEWPVLAEDGKSKLKEVPVKKGQRILISIFAANRDKRVWGEDAEEWKPERWLRAENPVVSDIRLPGVYSSMMTFFGGGRACIGFKLAEIELKLLVSALLQKFIFEPGPPVFWEMTGIARPTVPESGSAGTQLPLKVSLYKV